MLNKVCFIILNYNNYTDTINCIHSLQSTIRRDMYDIIVVDNNSSNDSVSQLRKCLNDVEIIPNKVNRGYANGNNIGIKIAESRAANYVPAAAVIRRSRALSGFIGRKASAGG